MITDDILQSIIEALIENNFKIVTIEGMLIRLCLWHDGQTIHLTTPVYEGENYIPKSVKCALKQHCVGSSEMLRLPFNVNENTFTISLECTGSWNETAEELKILLYEFTWLAEEWKRLLNEKGREDLMPIYIRK